MPDTKHKEVTIRFKPRKPKRRHTKREFIANEDIRADEVRLIDEHGEQIDVMPTKQAITMAEDEGKDVILIAAKAKPPVAKLIEYSKHKYQQQQKRQQQKKNNRKTDIKELRLSPFIAAGDLDSRIEKVRDFLTDGYKVRLHVRFKGRQITRKEFGFEVVNKVISAVSEEGQVEMEPKMQGRMLTCQLMPVTKK